MWNVRCEMFCQVVFISMALPHDFSDESFPFLQIWVDKEVQEIGLTLFLWYIFRWGTYLYMSLFPSFHLFFRLSFCRETYLKNCALYDHYLYYTCLKWRYLLCFLFIFFKFGFLGFRGAKALVGAVRHSTVQIVRNIWNCVHMDSKEYW